MMEKLRAPVATMVLGFLLMVLGLALTHSLWSIVSATGGGIYAMGYIVARFRALRKRA